ncbi:hypothetical protein C8255_10715 [filamentous cyanobacterium CCP3]|nr:hypothetical protein C8255_10715 [filamentous cyanobacterium CCP3]
MPGSLASQGQQTKALLDWVEGATGCGLKIFQGLLNEIIGSASTEPKKLFEFTIQGKDINYFDFGEIEEEIKEFVEKLRDRVGDNSIDFSFIGRGSVKVFVWVSETTSKKLEDLLDADKQQDTLTNDYFPKLKPVNQNTIEFQKAQLIKTLRFREKIVSGHLALAKDFLISEARELSYQLDSELLSGTNTLPDIEKYTNKVMAINRKLDQAFERGKNRVERFYKEEVLASERVNALSGQSSKIRAVINDIACNLINSLSFIFSQRIREFSPVASGIAVAFFKTQNVAFDLGFEFYDCEIGSRNFEASALRWLNSISPGLIKSVDLEGGNLNNLVLGWLNLSSFDISNAFVKNSLFNSDMAKSDIIETQLLDRSEISQELPFSNSLDLLPASSLHEIFLKGRNTLSVSFTPKIMELSPLNSELEVDRNN